MVVYHDNENTSNLVEDVKIRFEDSKNIFEDVKILNVDVIVSEKPNN